MKTISRGFITNSSTVVTVVVLDKNQDYHKVLNEKAVEKLIQEKFDTFVKEDLHLYYEDIHGSFINAIKREIHGVAENLLKHINSTEEELFGFETNCPIDGNSYDTSNPETYAAYFILKYALKGLAKSYHEEQI